MAGFQPSLSHQQNPATQGYQQIPAASVQQDSQILGDISNSNTKPTYPQINPFALPQQDMTSQASYQYLPSTKLLPQNIMDPRLSVKDAVQDLTSYIRPLIHQAHLTYFNHRENWSAKAATEAFNALGQHIINQNKYLPREFVSQTLSYLIQNTAPHYVISEQGDYFKANKIKPDRDNTNARLQATIVRASDAQQYELLNTLTPKQAQKINVDTGRNLTAGKADIGDGSFGIVRYARNMQTDEIVAVKKGSHEHMAKLEIKSMQQLSQQPKLVAPYSHASIPFQDENGNTVHKHYFFMPLYNEGDGVDASEKLHELKTVNLPEAELKLKHIAFSYLEAVAHLHKLGMAHRDIKLDNFLHSSKHGIGLADFGLAKKLLARVFKSTAGTNGYLPPEYGKKTYTYLAHDSFSLGLALLELKHGIEPWSINGPHLVIRGQELKIRQKLDTNLAGISSNNRLIQGLRFETFDEVIAGLLHANPAKRITPEQALNTPYFREYAISQQSAHVLF